VSSTQPTTERNAPAWVTWLLIVLGVVFIAVAIYYFATPAKSLPSFMPGHLANSNHHHSKHGIALLLLAAVSFVGAWFTSGHGRE
jgi:H+/Cl- antiporter ClcA